MLKTDNYGQVDQDVVSARQEATRVAMHEAGREAALQRARREIFAGMEQRGIFRPVHPITVTAWLDEMSRFASPYSPEDERQVAALAQLRADALRDLDRLHLSPPVGDDEL
jgi:hypothetical protein